MRFAALTALAALGAASLRAIPPPPARLLPLRGRRAPEDDGGGVEDAAEAEADAAPASPETRRPPCRDVRRDPSGSPPRFR